MSEIKFANQKLVKLQEYSWYVLLAYFTLAIILYFMQI